MNWLADSDWEAKLKGQVEAEPEQGDSMVLSLGPPFRRRARDAGRLVNQDDGHLGPTRKTAPFLIIW